MPKHTALAAKLLKDAADFFDTISQQNPELREQMKENASVFREVGKLVEDDPDGEVEGDTAPAKPAEPAALFARPAWWGPAFEAANDGAGDCIAFTQRPDQILWKAVEAHVFFDAADGLKDSMSKADWDLLKTAKFWTCTPPFYPQETLFHVNTDTAQTGANGLFLSYTTHASLTPKQHFVSLGFEVNTLHQVNRDAPLVPEGRELDYLNMFHHLITAELGKFRLVQGMLLTRLAALVRAQEGDGAKETAAKMHAPRFVRAMGTGGLLFRATILYGDAVFLTDIKLNYDGTVEMLDDEPLAGDLIFPDDFGAL